jgi:hypothetical protein
MTSLVAGWTLAPCVSLIWVPKSAVYDGTAVVLVAARTAGSAAHHQWSATHLRRGRGQSILWSACPFSSTAMSSRTAIVVAAAARADAWVTHLIDEHKGLRLSPRRVSAVPPQAQQNFQRYSQLLHVHFLVVGSSAERVCTSTYSVFMDLQRGHLRIPSCVSLPAYCL